MTVEAASLPVEAHLIAVEATDMPLEAMDHLEHSNFGLKASVCRTFFKRLSNVSQTLITLGYFKQASMERCPNAPTR